MLHKVLHPSYGIPLSLKSPDPYDIFMKKLKIFLFRIVTRESRQETKRREQWGSDMQQSGCYHYVACILTSRLPECAWIYNIQILQTHTHGQSTEKQTRAHVLQRQLVHKNGDVNAWPIKFKLFIILCVYTQTHPYVRDCMIMHESWGEKGKISGWHHFCNLCIFRWFCCYSTSALYYWRSLDDLVRDLCVFILAVYPCVL